MLGFSSAAGLMDPVSGRREFGKIEIYERVLTTGDRTISIDTIATMSVGIIPYRLMRWLCWIIAASVLLRFLSMLPLSFDYITRAPLSYSWTVILWRVGELAAVAGFFFLGRWFHDVNVLIIGASDGSRTVFRSKDIKFLGEVKDFITKKINENDLTAKLAADFKEVASRPLNQHFHGPVINNSGLMVAGDGNQIAHDSPGAMVGNGNIKLNGSGNRIGTHETSYALNGAAGVQIGAGNVSTGSHTSFAKIDFSQVLPQVGELQRHYAQSESMRHIEQRLTEMERLMRTGAVLPEQKSRVRELATDLGGFFQTYPALVQFFGHIGKLAGL